MKFNKSISLNSFLLFLLPLLSIVSITAGKPIHFIILIIHFIVGFLIYKFIDKQKLPQYFKTISMTFIWLNALGEIFEFYYQFEYYDKFLHLAVPLIMTMMLIQYLSKRKVGVLIPAFVVIGICASWEIVELILSTTLGARMMGVIIDNEWVLDPFTDTMADLILGTIGSLFYAVIHKVSNKKAKWF